MARKVRFVDQSVDPGTLRELWIALGQELEVVESVTELGLLFRSGALDVNRAWRESTDLWGRLTLTLLQVMRFEKYTDIRWLTIGGSARTLTASRLLGLDSLVAHIRADPSSSDYYVGGYSRLSEACKHFTAIAALCSYVGDGSLRRFWGAAESPCGGNSCAIA